MGIGEQEPPGVNRVGNLGELEKTGWEVKVPRWGWGSHLVEQVQIQAQAQASKCLCKKTL